MDKQTVVLITGANRGIGLGLANLYLADAQATVILTTRTDPNSLRETLPETFPATLLGIYRFDSTSDTAANSLAEELATKISRIDIVIANAGTGESFTPVRATSPDQLREYFEVNSLGPFKLYQGMSALLDKSAEPKFILVSSVLGSITEMNPTPCGAYGASKAAANFLVRKIHLEEERVVAVALHPGWVKTGNGQAFADAVGVAEPPSTVEESVTAIVKRIQDASNGSLSGKFIDAMSGRELPW